MEVILLGIAKGKNICNIAKEGGETITPDREKEFAEHRSVSQELRGKRFYFPPPHNPCQRGTNENTNGLLREYFLKQKDIADYTDEYIWHLSLTK